VNISNALTLSRLVAIPLLMALLLMEFPYHDQIAAALFIVFSLTDTLDGQLARRRGTVSDFGKFLDPLADKLFVLSVLIVLVQEGLVAAWVVVVVFSRELIITILRSVAANQGRASAVVLLILQRPYPPLGAIADVAVAVAIVFTIWSGVDYLWRFRHYIGRRDTRRPERAEDPSPAAELGDVLKRNRMTVAVAESSTAGLLGAMIADVPGSSAYFVGGVLAYSNEAKREELGVPDELLRTAGAVSREVAEAMASGARSRFHSTLAAAITGIAGPDADGTTKPVGLTYIAVASPGGTSAREFKFAGDRATNRRQSATEALAMLTAEAKELRAGVKSA
jgi:CDP-diacylglycerol--glycerol-3-phosphate 3-phosphatidyltransferase